MAETEEGGIGTFGGTPKLGEFPKGFEALLTLCIVLANLSVTPSAPNEGTRGDDRMISVSSTGLFVKIPFCLNSV